MSDEAGNGARELRYPTRELPPDLKCQIPSFLRITFPDGFRGADRLRDWITRDDTTLHIMLVERGLLISHTEVKWKYLEHCGVTYKVYGLSGVLTYPTFRNQGYGRRIVDAGTDYIAATDADIGMFHCAPHLQPFYARSGWSALAGATTLIGARDHPDVSEQCMMTQFLSAKGKRGRSTFERVPVYFGDDTW